MITATQEAIEHARLTAGCSDRLRISGVEVDSTPVMRRVADSAMACVLAHLQGFASAASHDDLLAEIDALYREVIR